jgi:cytochrome c oxidase subunit 2
MAASPTEAAQAAEPKGPNHGLRIFLIWLPIAVAADLLIWIVLSSHLPPGNMSDTAHSQQWTLTVLSVLGAPVTAFVLVFAGYALIVWRHREGDEDDGPPIHGHTGIQATWITVSAVIVLFLAGFGTFELAAPGFAGAGAGEGPSAIWRPSGAPLQIQVIGQQWRFTYRYPQYGGFETTQLVMPVNQPVQFNVTSIDVIHSFWAYQLGVKADANPGVNNIAFTTPKHLGEFTVRCAELCGLWHGAMTNNGYVVTVGTFRTWATHTEASLAAVTATLPPYSTVYDPNVVASINQAMAKQGIVGGQGYYYPPNDPVEP